ncbi:hypothetical protein T492DRAFT_1146571 [Pavlovales sp. CCMP2436]|nr:hypothetical protein T492DRAFT_1146571 [Pavlovales sp. CCMP2436]
MVGPLSDLAQRLVHPLEEVRSRALRSLLSKLAGGLLAPADLAYERDLQQNLLSLLSAALEPSLRREAIALLGRIAEHPHAAAQLGALGAVSALHVAMDADPSVREPAMAAVDKLFHVPREATFSTAAAGADIRRRLDALQPSLAAALPPLPAPARPHGAGAPAHASRADGVAGGPSELLLPIDAAVLEALLPAPLTGAERAALGELAAALRLPKPQAVLRALDELRKRTLHELPAVAFAVHRPLLLNLSFT